MKVLRISSLLLGLALLLATSAFADNKGSLTVTDQVSVSGKQLAPGDYTVKWDGNGPEVELSILQGKNVVATSPARLSDLNRPASYNSAVVKTNGDGSKSLAEIRFSGKKYFLTLGTESAKAQSTGSN